MSPINFDDAMKTPLTVFYNKPPVHSWKRSIAVARLELHVCSSQTWFWYRFTFLRGSRNAGANYVDITTRNLFAGQSEMLQQYLMEYRTLKLADRVIEFLWNWTRASTVLSRWHILNFRLIEQFELISRSFFILGDVPVRRLTAEWINIEVPDGWFS